MHGVYLRFIAWNKGSDYAVRIILNNGSMPSAFFVYEHLCSNADAKLRIMSLFSLVVITQLSSCYQLSFNCPRVICKLSFLKYFLRTLCP